MSGPEAWFVDEDLLGLAHILAEARRAFDDVHYVGDHHVGCPARGMVDTEWAPMLRGREWAVIRKDVSSRRRSRPAEFHTFQDNGLGVFVMRAKNASRFDQARLVLKWWDELNTFWSENPRPFFARFSATQRPHLKPQG